MLLDITNRSQTKSFERMERTLTWLPTDNQALIIRVIRISEVKGVNSYLTTHPPPQHQQSIWWEFCKQHVNTVALVLTGYLAEAPKIWA
jgi:hypothetical protein